MENSLEYAFLHGHIKIAVKKCDLITSENAFAVNIYLQICFESVNNLVSELNNSVQYFISLFL